MLSHQKIVAFVPVRSADAARAFYRDTLGLHLLYEDGFALVFDIEGTMLRATLMRDFEPQKFTVLGWQVADAVAAAQQLVDAGVSFERFPGIQQDEHALWHAPGGAVIGWFKDPDGNILSISQHP